MASTVTGFSKLDKSEKIDWLLKNHLKNDTTSQAVLKQYWNDDKSLQELHDGFSENTISNYYLP